VTPNAEKLMPSDDRYDRMIEEARGRSEAEAKVSIEDLAAELGKSIRTLRRWNARPDAPQRIRRGRRLIYRRTDVQAWPGRTSGAGDDPDEGAA
jgi:hypothetical protein